MQHRFIKKTGARLIAVILTVHAVVLRAQDPFPSVPPGGSVPYGQSPNGYNPVYGSYQPSVVPSQPIAPIRPDGFPGGPTPPMRAAPPYGPLSGQQQTPGGAVQATYLGQSGPGMGGGRPAAPATLCPGAQVLARVGNEVILTSDVLVAIDTVLAGQREKIPPEKFAAQRAAMVEEATAGIAAFNAHANDPDPVKAMTPAQRGLIYQLLQKQVEVKMLFQDFKKTVPKEYFPQFEEKITSVFEEKQVPILMKRENVVSRADLENALRAKGSSLDRERRDFMEEVASQEWARQQLKPEKDGKPDEEEVTHEEMLTWYNSHLKDFEHPAQARWEELMVSFARHPNHDEAYAILADLGNRVLAGAILSDVAKSASEGPTAREGGQHDWTHKDSLASETLNQAIFNQPVMQLSPHILESENGYHIIRVLARQEQSWTSFLNAQKQVKEKIQDERYQ